MSVVQMTIEPRSLRTRRGSVGREWDHGSSLALSRRLGIAILVARSEVLRSAEARRDATRLRLQSARARVLRRRSTSRAREAQLGAGSFPWSTKRDPLLMTIAVARACDRVSEIAFFDAGRRTESPVQLVAHADTFSSGGDAAGERPCDTRLHIYASSSGDQHLVRLVGELDLVDADHVRNLLVAEAGSTVVLDLTDLRFVDAAGVAGIVAAGREIRSAGHSLVVRGARGIVRRVFEITELGHLLRD
jgi:anti-anti-sigma factor